MAKIRKQPRILSKVLDAISKLKEVQGSTQKRIVEHISHIYKKNPRLVAVQVKKALERGVRSGQIKQTNGKYTLVVGKKHHSKFRSPIVVKRGTKSGIRKSKRRKQPRNKKQLQKIKLNFQKGTNEDPAEQELRCGILRCLRCLSRERFNI